MKHDHKILLNGWRESPNSRATAANSAQCLLPWLNSYSG